MRAPARWWGDRVEITALGDGTGSVDRILERKNAFSRPAVANMDQLVMIAAELTRSLIPSGLTGWQPLPSAKAVNRSSV